MKFNVQIDHTRDELLTNFGKAVLHDRYRLKEGESSQDIFVRVATTYADNEAHAQRLYDYISKLWYMPSTPILSNAGSKKNLPISCFLVDVEDDIGAIIEMFRECGYLATRGGGIGVNFSKLRSIGEGLKEQGKTGGIVPFLKMLESQTSGYSQGAKRRGSAAAYLDISHPEIMDFLNLRNPSGGSDPKRRCLDLFTAVTIPDVFMKAVERGDMWSLKSPKTGAIMEEVSARDIWTKLLEIRLQTGAPYLFFIDNANAQRSDIYEEAGLEVSMSNLCSEIMLHTGLDLNGYRRTAVCCLSSLNIDKYDEWNGDPQFIEDVMRFLDNVLEDFIMRAEDGFDDAVYAALHERSVGLGLMGWQSYLQSKMIPMTSDRAAELNIKIMSQIRGEVDKASLKLGEEKGICFDAAVAQSRERFANKMAIAPTASISIICGGVSPCIEPMAANNFLQKTLTGSFSVKNKYLEQLLEGKGKNTQEVWESITRHEGSVAHLDFLTNLEREVFKTAIEIDQLKLVEINAARQKFVDQGISFNIFARPDIDKSVLHNIHYKAWKLGLKSMYYCRSVSLQRADKITEKKTVCTDEVCEVCQ